MKTKITIKQGAGQKAWRVNVAGIFLAALLTASPQSAQGQGVIAVNSTSGANLDLLFGPPTNSVTVNPGITINNSGGGTAAVSGGTRPWNLTNNAGSISGANEGVYLTSGGRVNNLTTNATISGGNFGVAIEGTNGTVVNGGSITGYSEDGVNLQSGGRVTNFSGGNIRGGNNGVAIGGGAGTVVNAGTITGTNNAGVNLYGGGSVNNMTASAIISGGNNGVAIGGGAGTVVNAGSIAGTASDGIGVYLGAGGSVNNLTTNAIILGGFTGVEIYGGAGTVANAGSITGTAIDGIGVYMDEGGSVTNFSGGIIGGEYIGVDIADGAGSVVNAGTITGTASDGIGVYLGAGGSVTNMTENAIISGGQVGVEIFGGAGTVANAGNIIGNSGTAIQLDDFANSVTLQTGSVVQGNIVGGSSTDSAYLQGNGSYSNSFLNFETLTVQSDYTGWNLTGPNTFSTGATVQSGLLWINGTLGTPLLTVMDSSGGLGGAGVINGTVDNHGYFAPGNAIGTLTINGSMTNWGDYYAEVDDAGNSDLIQVNGTATINGGGVIVQPAFGTYSSNILYTLLTATNGVIGTFDTNVNSATLFYSALLSYGTNDVFLTLERKAFSTAARSDNQKAVAGALDGIVNAPGALSNLVSEVLLLGTASQAQAALDSLSGELHGTLGMLDVQQQNTFNQSVLQRTGRMSASPQNGGMTSRSQPIHLADAGGSVPLSEEDASQPHELWVQGFGSFGSLDGDGNAAGGDFTIGGLSGGFDNQVSPELLLGVAVGYSQNNADVGGPGANGTVDAFQVGGYGGYVNGPWRLDGVASYGFLQTDTTRPISVGSIQETASGNYNGGVISMDAEGGYVFEFTRVTVEPTVGLSYTHLSQDGFRETGSTSGLQVGDMTMNSFRSALGARLVARFGREDGVQYLPALRLVWAHEFADKNAEFNARFIGGGGDFKVRGLELGADTVVVGAGLTVGFNKSVQGFVNYNANLNSRLSSSTFSGGLSYSW